MFHWICPECGREIAPQAKECPVCDPSVSAAPVESTETGQPILVESKSEPPLLAAPIEKAPAPLQPGVAGAPKPLSALPLPIVPAGRDLSPVPLALASAQPVSLEQAILDPEPARAPRFSHAPLREPQPTACHAGERPQAAAEPEPTCANTRLPSLSHLGPPAPPLARLANDPGMAVSSIRPSIGKPRPTGGAAKEQLSLPGPTLPHELTSLSAAGIAKILLASDRPAVPKKSNWALSLVVAAAVIAGTLGATFYAMPGLANAPAAPKEVAREKPAPEPSQPAPPADPLARVVEVTGIRFVTDVPGRQPQISYLVVNHSNVPLLGVSVSVTLRGSGRDDLPPISQFSFRAPRLGPYESKEMVSSIERFNGSVALPDWRDVRAEVRISQ